jgi:hypothetical protein
VSALATKSDARAGDRAARARRSERRQWPSLFDAAGGEPTLDDVLAGAWEGLTAHRTVDCPVCAGELAPAYGAHARPTGGRCGGCGSTLA